MGEKKEKEAAKEKRLKEEEERKKRKKENEKKANDSMQCHKVPLAIEAPPGIMEPKITSGTVAPMPASNGAVPDNSIWRDGIPRSRSEEDDDFQRALAESLGQVYVAPKRPNRGSSISNQGISGINNHNSFNSAQSEVSYENALDMLLNNECCFGLYDFKIKQWRCC